MENAQRKQALITAEQEALIRALEKAKKLEYGQLTIYVASGRIERYEILQSRKIVPGQTNTHAIKQADEDMSQFDSFSA